MSMDMALRGTIEEINRDIANHQSGFLQRQIEWRQALIERYQAEIEELTARQDERDSLNAEADSATQTVADTLVMSPITVAKATQKRVRGTRK